MGTLMNSGAFGAPFQYQKISKEEQESRGILGRLAGIIADPNKATRNGRRYGKDLWQKVLDDPIFNEKLQNRVIFGEFEHPVDGRTSIEPKNITVCLAEKPKFGKDGYLYGVFDILNTECGKLLKTLLDYGSTFAISSRGDGDLFTNARGEEEVDPDTYQCFCWDIVSLPGVKEARLQPVTESLDTSKKSLNESLAELLNNSSDKDTLAETINNLGINLSEAIKEDADEAEKPKVDYSALAAEAKKLLDDRYGKITNNANLEDALETAVTEQKKQDVQIIAKLICKYDPDFADAHDKVKKLAESPMVVDTDTTEAPTEDNLDDFSELNAENADDSIGDINQEEPSSEEEVAGQDILDQAKAEVNNEESSQESQGSAGEAEASSADNTTSEKQDVINDSLDVSGDKINKKDENLIVYNNMNESKDWTQEELNKASEWMKEHGYMTFEEFQKACDEGAFELSQQQEEVPVEDIDEVESKEEDGNAMLEMVNTLQEALKAKQDIEADVLRLNEKLSVCYAKEASQNDTIVRLQEQLNLESKHKAELEETKSQIIKQSTLIESANQQISSSNVKLEKFKARTEKQSALIESANATIKDLNSKCQDITLKYNALVEKYNALVEKQKANRSEISSLNESLSSASTKTVDLSKANAKLNEDLARVKTELKESKEQYQSKLEHSNTLVEKYKKVASRAINKYIDSQALKLDITSNEIKNRLPENYTFNDIDSICESLQKQKVSMNLLPFKRPNKLYESMNVEITGKERREPLLDDKHTRDDEIDESLKSLAGM